MDGSEVLPTLCLAEKLFSKRLIYLIDGTMRGGMKMNEEIDFEQLRYDLKDYYGTAMVGGFPMVMIDLSEVESASNMELLKMAIKNSMDLSKYIK